MYRKVLFSMIGLFFFALSYSNEQLKSDVKSGLSNIVELGAINLRQVKTAKDMPKEYLADIYAHNKDIMAGVQLELEGEDFTVLNVEGGRVGDNNFITHVGSKRGVILAFSMTGKMIAAIDSIDQTKNTLFTLHFKKNVDGPSEFKMKALLANKTGDKLDSNFIPFLID